MNKDLHDIDDLFKNSIDGHAEEVPPDVWNNIDHSLDKKQAAFYKRKYFTVRAAAILLVLIGGATIAAILRFHNPERRSRLNSENAVTVSGVNKAGKARKNKIEEDSFNKPVEGKTNSIAKNIPLDNKETNGFDTTGSTNKTAIAKKESSKKYSSMNSRTYSAQKNEGLTTISHSNKTQKQKVPVKYKPVLETSVDFVTSQSNNKVEEKKTIERSGKIIDTPKETKIISRTTLFEAKPLKENPAGLVATLSLTHLKSSINFAVSSSVAQKSRPGISLHSWSISPMYAQNINLNTLKDDDHFRDPRNNRLEAKRTEQRSTGFTAGLGIQKEIGENVVLQTGIQYFLSQTDIQPKTIFARPDDHGDVRYQFRCSSGDSYLSSKTGTTPSVGDSIKTSYSKSILSYLQVPLLVSYKIGFGRFSFMPSAGFQTNFLLGGKLNSSLSNTTGEEEVSSSIKGLKPMYWSGAVQPQLNYKLNDQISFDFSPNINFSLSPINKETAVRTYQNMLSLGAGVRIKL